VEDITQLNKYPYCGHSAILGIEDRIWQDVNTVLEYFGKTVKASRESYLSYVASGFDQGHRDELTGGGLIRSLGGWSEIARTHLKRSHTKSDERILGESTVVSDVLSQANEKYELKRLGFDLNRLAVKVSEIYDIDVDDFLSKGKQQKKVKARSLFCYWASRELEVSLTELSRRIGISVPAVGYSVERGSIIAKENNYNLIEDGT
jgi:putative transposase